MVAVLVALAIPVVLDRDSFPLSTFPMYARTRSSEVALVTAQGVGGDGRIVALSLETIGASDDPLVVAGELRADVRLARADDRCRTIADRLEALDPDAVDLVDPDARIESVQVVTERHDVVEAVDGGRSLRERVVHARCPVGP